MSEPCVLQSVLMFRQLELGLVRHPCGKSSDIRAGDSFATGFHGHLQVLSDVLGDALHTNILAQPIVMIREVSVNNIDGGLTRSGDDVGLNFVWQRPRRAVRGRQ